MAEQEYLKEFNFFTKPVTNTKQFVNKKPFSKLAFLGLAIGCGFAIMLSGSEYMIHSIQIQESKQDQANLIQSQNVHEQIKKIQESQENYAKIVIANSKIASDKIKKISPEAFSNFINYLKMNQELYDSRIHFINDAIIKDQSTDSQHALDGLTTSSRLDNLLSEYKKSFETKIIQYNNTYQHILNGNTDIPATQINQLLNDYDLSSSGIFITDVNLEKEIHQVEYAKNKTNVSYNLEHNVFEKMTQLEKESVTKRKMK
jgi:hypothetical protein